MRIPVVCVSLGGTKFDIGLLLPSGKHISTGEIYWRSLPKFSGCMTRDIQGECFSQALIDQIIQFLYHIEYNLADVDRLGIAFPGPRKDGLWYSNNLTPRFTLGVELESILGKTMAQVCDHPPEVSVALDAQCDAGGELFHPDGRLLGYSGAATVLNIATGIAAGFVAGGHVLVTDQEIHQAVDPRYDAGVGHLGRHLWFDEAKQTWSYIFCRDGQTPRAKGIRLSDRLSGPAIVARLMVWFEKRQSIEQVVNRFPHLDALLKAHTSYTNLLKGIRLMPREQMKAFLQWVNARALAEDLLGQTINEFGKYVSVELAEAISAWRKEPGWTPFSSNLVLTGGIGINFLNHETGLTHQLQQALPNTYIQRSSLRSATEREMYFFLKRNINDN